MAKAITVAEQTTSTGMQQIKTAPARLKEFIKDVRSEMKKVWWPGRAEVQSTTIVVLITTFLFAGFFALVDLIFSHLVALIFKVTGAQ